MQSSLLLILACAHAQNPPPPTPAPPEAPPPAPVAEPAPAPTLPAEPLEPIAADRVWAVLTEDPDRRVMLRQAAELLGDWSIELAGVEIDGPSLLEGANKAPDEPLIRILREHLGRPVDVDDLLYFLDDVLVAGATRRGEPFSVGSGRARAVGILVHPDGVFKSRPRIYPHRTEEISVDKPPPQTSFPVAKDEEILGPNWTMRYRSPTDPPEMYATLVELRPESSFPSRVAALVSQIEQQGGEVYLTSFLRYRERGYLMWGAHELRSCESAACVTATIKKLEEAKSWAPVPITWSHPDGWEQTREAARRMADAFDVVYATERGARTSKHYDGVAVDFVAMDLPRSLELYAPDGAHQVFDLSAPEQTRDLSLTPELIEWVEAHFGMSKLRSDYPHWTDTR
ncbi:MAG TPA: hypothetical protein ENK18_22575 [Deltaproteobacteria bacterium]|nr:hypothetical protein [Deltaproteobacteria bacterium]